MDAFRILIVDDNPAIHDDIRRILELHRKQASALDALEAELFGDTSRAAPVTQKEFVLESAYQGQDAHRMLKEALAQGQPYTLAFVDVRMPPGWDGIETISRLWEEDPALQIVICTAFSDYSWTSIIEKLGQSDNMLVVKKPFDSIEVLQTTHALTRKWLLQRQLEARLGDLESVVEHRNRELEEINQELRCEILERRRAESDLKHLATHDPLTELPNRILLNEWLHQAFARAKRYSHSVGLLLLDLDYFKEVNDSLGHKIGDILLQQVAKRLQQSIRECDMVARMGGDEFVVVLDEIASRDSAEAAVKRITDSLRNPVDVGEHSLHVNVSIGISVHPADGPDVENLIKTADVAMYKAKREGRNTYRFFAREDNAHAQSLLTIKENICRALDRDEFEVWYQPVYDLETMAMAGVEALVRWRHPEHGVTQPMDFIHTAETTGQIAEIGEFVLRTACRQIKQWRDAGLLPIPVAVNISPYQLYHGDLVQSVQRCIDEVGLQPGFLELELTESTATRDLVKARNTLVRLHELGVPIVIDDFGAGYSSLTRLKNLPVDALKIDQFFIQNVVHDQRDAAIVTAIIALARSLGIQVIAEGVETQEQLDFLRNLKWDASTNLRCERVQGFLFNKPLPPDDASRVLREATRHALPPASSRP